MNFKAKNLIKVLPHLFASEQCEVYMVSEPTYIIACFELGKNVNLKTGNAKTTIILTLTNGKNDKTLILSKNDKIKIRIVKQ